MKIFVTAKTNAKNVGVKKIDETHFAVSVKELPHEGKANHAILKTLAKYFGAPLSRTRLIRGTTSKQKVFEIS